MVPPLVALVTSKTTYIIGSLSVVFFTLTYYLAYPPVVRTSCANFFASKYSSANQNVSSPPAILYYSNTSRPGMRDENAKLKSEKEARIVPFDSAWLTEKAPEFDIYRHDVLVYLHIQKTGGTQFDEFLTRHVRGAQCKCDGAKTCTCNRPQVKLGEADYGTDYGDEDYEEGQDNTWLFSRSSNHRWGCGVHADWTELTNCVPALLDREEKPDQLRRFFYITQLRDPVERFVSEWLHVKRGATWKSSRHHCNHMSHSITPCYPGSSWVGVSIEEFLACPTNLAFNRQTRMLADLSLVNCYDVITKKHLNNTNSQPIAYLESKMLQSAKENLLRMAFFGILGRNEASQKLLGASLGLEFEGVFATRDSNSEYVDLSPQLTLKIKQRNRLDLELLSFARDEFERRSNLLQK